MIGLVDIFIEKNTNNISILIYHINEIGFGEGFGNILELSNPFYLKQIINESLEKSLYKYGKKIKKEDPFKKTKYKTWSKFFDAHYVVGVTYEIEKQLYRITMPERDRKSKSFGNTVSGFDFKINKEEYNAEFDNIMKKILDNLEKYQN